MVQKSANRFVLGTKRFGTRSPDRRQYGLSIDTLGINGLRTGDDRQPRLIKFMQASSLPRLWTLLNVCIWRMRTSQIAKNTKVVKLVYIVRRRKNQQFIKFVYFYVSRCVLLGWIVVRV